MKSIDRIDSQNRCPRMRMSKLEGRVTVRGTNFKWDARDKFNLRREWPVPGTRCQEFWAKADAIVASERLLDRHVNMLRTKEYGSRASWSAWILETEGLSLWCRFPCSLIRDSHLCKHLHSSRDSACRVALLQYVVSSTEMFPVPLSYFTSLCLSSV